MSLSAGGNVKPVLVEDKRMGFVEQAQFGVIKSGRQNTFNVFPTQNYSTSNVQFNAQPPSPSTAISRQILVKFFYQVAITATAGASGYVVDPGLYDAPRQFPIAKTTNTITATINNANVNQNNYQVIDAFMRSNTSDMQLKNSLSTAPSAPDVYQNYSDPYTYSLGIVNDPLQSFGQSALGYQPRGGFPFTVVSNPNVGTGNSGTAVITFSSVEPLILSPFLSTGDNEAALLGVQTLNITINLLNLNRVWSHSDDVNASTITAMTITLPTPPQLQLNFITPSQLEQIPKKLVYNYNNVDVYTTDTTSATSAGATTTMVGQNIQFNTIPRRIYCFLKRRDADATVSTTDTFARINSVNISFDNQSGILGGASTEQLYEASRNSGLNMSWAQWDKYTGSVLILDVGRTLMLQNESEAPSLTATKQFQITVNFTNINTVNAVQFTMYLLVISDGLMTIESGATVLQNSILSPADIINAREGERRHWEESTNYFGGNFFKAIKNVGKHALDFAKNTRAVSNIALAAGHPELAALAHTAGYGLEGGKFVSKKHLKKNFM